MLFWIVLVACVGCSCLCRLWLIIVVRGFGDVCVLLV